MNRSHRHTVTLVASLLALVAVAPAAPAPARAMTSNEASVWQELQASESASPEVLRLREVVRRQQTSRPTAEPVDGRIYGYDLQHQLVSLDPATGARRNESTRHGALTGWGPAGDRLLTNVTELFVEDPRIPPEDGIMFYHHWVSNEDGALPLWLGASTQVWTGSRWNSYGDVVLHGHSPFGPRFDYTELAFHGLANNFHRGYDLTATMSGFGRPAPTPRGGHVLAAADLRDPAVHDLLALPFASPLRTTSVLDPDPGAAGEPIRLNLEALAPSSPVPFLAPGRTIGDADAPTYLAFTSHLGGQPRLFVDHADGRGAVDTGVLIGCDNGIVVSPSRTRVVVTGRVTGTPNCSSDGFTTQVLTASPSGKFDLASGATTTVLASGVYPVDWRPQTPWAATARIGGANRLTVAIEASQAFHEDKTAELAVVAGSTAYADALTGGPMAGEFDGTVLLTPPDALPSTVGTELTRALADGATIYVAGGPASVSETVVEQLQATGHPVKRLGGANRYQVAVNIAKERDALRGTGPRTTFVTSGWAFADALVAGPPSVLGQGPVLLTNGSTMPAVTKDYLDTAGPNHKIFAIGGSGRAAVTSVRPDANVVDGADRYAVARNVAETFYVGPSSVLLADGRNWPDAVAAGAAGGQLGVPVLLSTSTLPTSTRAWIRKVRPSADSVLAFGGQASVPDAVLSNAAAVAGRQTVHFGPDLP